MTASQDPVRAGRLRPLSRRERLLADDRIRTADTLAADPQALNALITLSHQLRHAAGQFAALIPPPVLWSGTRVLDANGSARVHARITSGSLWVFSPSCPLTVVAGTYDGVAPGPGAGVFTVPANIPVTLNARTPSWSVYGTAGDIVNLSLFAAPAAPDNAIPGPYTPATYDAATFDSGIYA